MKMKFYLIVLSLLAVCLWGTGDVRAQSASRSMTLIHDLARHGHAP